MINTIPSCRSCSSCPKQRAEVIRRRPPYGLLAKRGKTERLNLCCRLMRHRRRKGKRDQQSSLQWLAEVSARDRRGTHNFW